MSTPKHAAGMLVLEDGSTFIGRSMGAEGEWVGEVVFSTGMSGYQEVITDPSHWGQMVVFTCPHIGNAGVNREDMESERPYVRAVLARQICEQPSNWRAEQSLPDHLRAAGVPALSGVDTRKLTLLLREKGAMRGALSTLALDEERLLRMAQNAPSMDALAPVQHVARSAKLVWTDTVAEQWNPLDHATVRAARAPHVVVLDCGSRTSLFRTLVFFGAAVTVLPPNAACEEILGEQPDGVLVSSGPGDVLQAPDIIDTVRQLIGRVPLFGTCFGHQAIGIACGASRYKLRSGHYGANHPVQNTATGRVEITLQSHSYAIDAASLRGLPLEVSHVSLNDGTVEGLRHTELPVASVQFLPEASPGPHDSLSILRDFVMSLHTES